jgi:hypothetical protein
VEVFGITDGGELEISLLYRAKGSTEYLELSMAKEEGKYVAIIPAEKTQASGLEYYFKADNGTKVVFLSQSGEGEPHPFSVEVSAYETGLGVEDLTVSPNPFLLQARDEAVAINYLLTAEAQVSIKIYNLRGRLIKSFSASGQQRGTQRLLWDGRDYNGRLIPSGSYLVQIEARGEETRAVVRRLKAVLVLR